MQIYLDQQKINQNLSGVKEEGWRRRIPKACEKASMGCINLYSKDFNCGSDGEAMPLRESLSPAFPKMKEQPHHARLWGSIRFGQDAGEAQSIGDSVGKARQGR